jgi:hypothetical protein
MDRDIGAGKIPWEFVGVWGSVALIWGIWRICYSSILPFREKSIPFRNFSCFVVQSFFPHQ